MIIRLATEEAVVGTKFKIKQSTNLGKEILLRNEKMKQIVSNPGGSFGLVVMGGDSYSEGRGLKSQHHYLDGHFPHLFVVNFVSKTKINEKEGREDHFCIKMFLIPPNNLMPCVGIWPLKQHFSPISSHWPPFVHFDSAQPKFFTLLTSSMHSNVHPLK